MRLGVVRGLSWGADGPLDSVRGIRAARRVRKKGLGELLPDILVPSTEAEAAE
jgi:hypothetical protein